MRQFTVIGQKGPGCAKLDLGSADEISVSQAHDDQDQIVVNGWNRDGRAHQFRHEMGTGEVRIVVTAKQDGD